MKPVALGGLAICAVLVLTGLLTSAPAAEGLLVVGAFGTPAFLMMLGATQRAGVGPVAGVLVALLLLLVGSGLTMLFLRDAAEPWVLGLPIGAALQLYAACALPLLFMPVAYAVVFERHTLRSEDLEALRRRTRRPPTQA